MWRCWTAVAPAHSSELWAELSVLSQHKGDLQWDYHSQSRCKVLEREVISRAAGAYLSLRSNCLMGRLSSRSALCNIWNFSPLECLSTVLHIWCRGMSYLWICEISQWRYEFLPHDLWYCIICSTCSGYLALRLKVSELMYAHSKTNGQQCFSPTQPCKPVLFLPIHHHFLLSSNKNTCGGILERGKSK